MDAPKKNMFAVPSDENSEPPPPSDVEVVINGPIGDEVNKLHHVALEASIKNDGTSFQDETNSKRVVYDVDNERSMDVTDPDSASSLQDDGVDDKNKAGKDESEIDESEIDDFDRRYGLETQEMKDRLLQKGDIVYAPFPGKNPSNERTCGQMDRLPG